MKKIRFSDLFCPSFCLYIAPPSVHQPIILGAATCSNPQRPPLQRAGLVWPVRSFLPYINITWDQTRHLDFLGQRQRRHDMRCLEWLWQRHRRHGPARRGRTGTHWHGRISCGTGRRRRRRLWYSSAALPRFLESSTKLHICGQVLSQMSIKFCNGETGGVLMNLTYTCHFRGDYGREVCGNGLF